MTSAYSTAEKLGQFLVGELARAKQALEAGDVDATIDDSKTIAEFIQLMTELEAVSDDVFLFSVAQ